MGSTQWCGYAQRSNGGCNRVVQAVTAYRGTQYVSCSGSATSRQAPRTGKCRGGPAGRPRRGARDAREDGAILMGLRKLRRDD